MPDTNMIGMLSQGKCLKLDEKALEKGLYDLLLDIAPALIDTKRILLELRI